MPRNPWPIALLAAPLAIALLAMTTLDQDPQNPENRSRLRFAELQYVTATGTTVPIAAKDIDEIKLHTRPHGSQVLLEIYYQNGDYSLIQTEGFHIIRRGAAGTQEVSLIRTEGEAADFTFPKIR